MKSCSFHWFLILFLALATGAAESDASTDSFPEITAQELKSKLDSGKKLFLLNPLSAVEFNDQHIPGSVNIPAQSILISKRLPKDKNQLIVTYCLGRK